MVNLEIKCIILFFYLKENLNLLVNCHYFHNENI